MIVQQLLGPNGLMQCVEDENGNVDICWAGMVYYSFNRSNLFAKKLGVALLATIGILQKTICEFFKVSRHTIANVLEVYREKGIEGFISEIGGQGAFFIRHFSSSFFKGSQY